MFLFSEVCANKLVPNSELIIFIGYEDNSYWFMYYIQENITFHSTQAIFDEEFFPKYTNSHPKKYKLYNKLLKKISPETKSSVLGPSGKNGPAPVHIPHIYIPLIQNNSPTHFS